MWPLFVKLLAHSWAAFLASIGTTSLGFLTPAIIFLVALAGTLFHAWKRQGWAGMKEHVQKTLTLAFFQSLCFFVLVYGVIFGWAVVSTVYQDHVRLVLLDQTLASEKADCERLNHQLQGDYDKLKAQRCANPTPQSAPPPQPAPAPTPSPNLASVRIAGQKQIPSTNPDYPYAIEVTIQTDSTIEPVAFSLICDGEIGKGDAGYPTGGAYTMMKSGVAVDPHGFVFEWMTPAFQPDTPIVVTLWSKTFIKAIQIQQIRYTSR